MSSQQSPETPDAAATWRPFVLVALFLAAASAFTARNLFAAGTLDKMYSIEGAYFSLARWIATHGFDLTGWFPLWYNGIPTQDAYPPAMHVLAAKVLQATRWTPAQAHHSVSVFFYCLGPVTTALLIWRLTSSHWRALIGGSLQTFVSLSALLMPRIGTDLGAPWRPRRLHTLIVYGDGPHVMAIALLPLALLALHEALERRTPVRWAVAVLALAAVALTNWLGAFALAVAAGCYLMARWSWIALRDAILLAVAAYALAMPWIPPSTIATIRSNAEWIGGRYPMGLPQAFSGVLLVAALFAGRWLWRDRTFALRFLALFAFAISAIPLAAEWGGLHLLPQPERYHLEMELALAMTIAVCARINRVTIATAVLVIAASLPAQVRYIDGLIRTVEPDSTIEAQVALTLNRLFPGQRVFLYGSAGFFLNAFTDQPQVSGGFAQGRTSEALRVIEYGIPFTKGDGEVCAMFLQAIGAQAVVVSGPNGRDAYHTAWNDADKFEGVLPLAWRQGGDAIYAVPARNPGLAHVVRPSDLPRRIPFNIEDVDAIRAYVAALNDPDLPVATLAPDLTVRARNVLPDHVISVQINYHPGWTATDASISKDAMGHLVLHPRCTDCQIRLRYNGGLELLFARIASWTAAAFFTAWWLVSLRTSRARAAPRHPRT